MACRNKDGQFQTVSGLLFVWIIVGQYAEEGNMPETICKIIKQYNKGSVASEDMRKLQEIAEDCRKVKNYVYDRFGGIGGLPKLYPGYTVQNEMTKTGLRGELKLPSVYFYLAVFDAVRDIKCRWARTKSDVLKRIGRNENLTAEEKHYLRFVLRVNNAFAAVLHKEEIVLEGALGEKHAEVSKGISQENMHRYLCRQVRKCHVKLRAELAEGFSASPKAYCYGDHGIYIATKERRRRLFIPLTDANAYNSQIYIKIFPEKCAVNIHVPVNVAVRSHHDYVNEVGIAMGMNVMATTDAGNRYGERLGEYESGYSDWVREQTAAYNRNRAGNPGRKKYQAKKRRFTERMHSYINQELNRLFEEEKPRIIYVAKLPKPQAAGKNRRVNQKVSMWQRGYIRKRLEWKCRERAVELVEVFGKGISSECSECGGEGTRKGGEFFCGACGYVAEEKANAARNAMKRGLSGKTAY